MTTQPEPAPALDLASLLGGGRNNDRVVDILAEVIRSQINTLSAERAERLDLRRRVDKLEELLERERARPDQLLSALHGENTPRVDNTAYTVLARVANALEVALDEDLMLDRIAALKRAAGRSIPVPPPTEPMALDTPPDNSVRPAQGAPAL